MFFGIDLKWVWFDTGDLCERGFILFKWLVWLIWRCADSICLAPSPPHTHTQIDLIWLLRLIWNWVDLIFEIDWINSNDQDVNDTDAIPESIF